MNIDVRGIPRKNKDNCKQCFVSGEQVIWLGVLDIDKAAVRDAASAETEGSNVILSTGPLAYFDLSVVRKMIQSWVLLLNHQVFHCK